MGDLPGVPVSNIIDGGVTYRWLLQAHTQNHVAFEAILLPISKIIMAEIIKIEKIVTAFYQYVAFYSLLLLSNPYSEVLKKYYCF